jgi:membrane protease YdiL (CAAX protease family)
MSRSAASAWRHFAVVVALLGVFFALVAHLYFRRYQLNLQSEASLYLCLMLLVVLAVVPAFPASRMLVERLARPALAPVLMICCLVPYLIYAFGCNDFRWPALIRLLALAGLPPLIYIAAPVRTGAKVSWQDAIVWTWLVMLMLLRKWNGIWNVPASLDFMARLCMTVVASWCWVFVRPVPGLGYSFSISVATLRAASLNFILFALIAIPAGLATHFATWAPRWRGLLNYSISYVEIFLFIAWLEELLFRGFLQSLLSSTLKSARLGQLVASVAFGFSHILLAPAPNWRYVALASIAGWFYGNAFRQSESLLASSLAHALVDAAWRTWFGGRG